MRSPSRTRCCAKSRRSRARSSRAMSTVSITRHYGETAAEKSNELLLHMGIAVVGVSLLIWLTLGWRESGIVAHRHSGHARAHAARFLSSTASPSTASRSSRSSSPSASSSMTRSWWWRTSSAIFICRRTRAGTGPTIAVEAVSEVGNPTILATFAVIAAVLPMAFVGGLMGPYMRPIPIGASAAMVWSLAHRLHRHAVGVDPHSALGQKVFASSPRAPRPRRRARPLRARGGFLHPALSPDHGAADRAARAGAGFFSAAITRAAARSRWRLVALGWVKVKMLPFDNKSEFQIILNMPEGSSLERTAQAAREIAAAVRTEPEVTDYQIYAGVAAPFNFNGLVRHYFMRARRERRGHSGQSRPKGERKRAEPRHRQTRPSACRGDRRPLRRARRRRRSAARPAGAANARRRNLRPE